MFCTKCGRELKPGTKFCGYCGAVVGKVNVQPKNKKFGRLGGIVAGAVVVVSIIIGIGMLLNREKILETRDIYLPVYEKIYSFEGDEIKETGRAEYTYVQTSDGITGSAERRTGSFERYWEVSYDLYGRKTAETEYSTPYAYDKSLTYTETYNYNEDGSYIKEINDSYGSRYRVPAIYQFIENEKNIVYEYDADGILTQGQVYDEDGNKVGWEEYERKKNTCVIKRYDDSQNLREREEQSYDKNGNLIERTVILYGEDFNTTDKYSYEYDEYGNVVSLSQYYFDGSGWRIEYTNKLFQVKNPEYYIK